jgi:hypothetical protein
MSGLHRAINSSDSSGPLHSRFRGPSPCPTQFCNLYDTLQMPPSRWSATKLCCKDGQMHMAHCQSSQDGRQLYVRANLTLPGEVRRESVRSGWVMDFRPAEPHSLLIWMVGGQSVRRGRVLVLNHQFGW